jgi:hypothetical protein
MAVLMAAAALLLLLAPPLVAASVAPEQVTLTKTNQPDEMIVSWISREPLPFPLPSPTGDVKCANMHNNMSMHPVPFPFPSPKPLPGSVVRFGPAGGKLSSTATNATLLFVSHKGGVGYRLVHNVVLRGLAPGSSYDYSVETAAASVPGGGAAAAANRSAVGTFTMLEPPSPRSALSTLVITDVPASYVEGAPYWLGEIERGVYDQIVHPGDIAYDIDDPAGTGDAFMAAMSQGMKGGASRLPYMALPGNHEAENYYCDFLSFRARFSHNTLVSGSGSPRYFSWDAGPVHFAGIDTDAYNQAGFNLPQQYWIKAQHEWLKAGELVY